MIRAFLAVELSEDLRKQLGQVQQDLKQRLGRDLSKDVRISWVQPASIHLTIKFLGDTDEALVEPMREAINQAVKGHRAIQIPIERLGAFPHVQQPRVLWVGASEQWEKGEEAKRLAALHRAVEDCGELLDFAPESRPLSPHLTLARIKAGERHLGQALAKSGVMDQPLSLGTLPVESLVLMKSELRPAGPVYTKLWEVRFP
ncbi:RNA 2',3'-cyclic phosphodiesterase [Nitrospira sp. NS4]|uniref:RNA 2',3'-cyclic phosphodiesterase n=1 Tax=Nitrospira sp. NS4 TaxID=3414498 RepID=UPI003C30B6D2